MIALGLMLTFTIIVIALMGLTMTTVKVSDAERVSSADRRAAENALESAINQVRMDPYALVGDPSHPCQSPIIVGDVEAQVACTLDTSGVGANGQPIAIVPDLTSAGGTVKVVGTRYQGFVAWNTNCGVATVGGVAQVDPGPGCFPWLAALGGANYNPADAGNVIATSGPTLVHSGPEPLTFAGDLQVRRGVTAVRNPVAGSPAIQVGGTFRQGSPGVGVGVGGNVGPSNPCGLLSPDHPWNVTSMQVGALPGNRLCNDSAAQSLGDSSALAQPSAPWDSAAVAAGAAAGAAVPSACPAGSVVQFSPGAYDAAAVQRLNALFNGSCHRTYQFLPGDYWFDADSGVTGSDRNALVFNDAGSNFVFGVASGWTASSSVAQVSARFPMACDTSANGVSITLSGRSNIRHSAGRVAICDRTSGGTAQAAIWQDADQNSVWTATANGVSTGEWHDGNLAYFPDGQLSRSQRVTCFFTCDGWRSLTLAGWTVSASDPLPATGTPLATLEAKVVGDVATNCCGDGDGDGAQTRFTVTVPDAGFGSSCDATFPWVATNASAVTTFNLLDPAFGNCAQVIRNPEQLVSPSTTVKYDLHLWRSGVPAWLEGVLDSIQLSFTAGAYTRPNAPMSVTIDEAAGATFNSFGSVSLPRNDFDIHWRGDTTSEPVVSGTMVVSGLGSDMSAGASAGEVCCTGATRPASRIVQLSAATDSVVATAVIEVFDTDDSARFKAGFDVKIRDWQVCPRQGAATDCA